MMVNSKNNHSCSFSITKFKLFLFIYLLCLATIYCSVMAEEFIPDKLVIKDIYVPGTGHSIGSVVIVDGEAIIVHEDELRGFLAKKGLLLYAGDTLITRSQGRISILLKDKSRISIGSETKLLLSRVLFDPDNKQRTSFIKMGIGKARFRVKKLSDFKRSSFKIKTHTALIGVRGSDFIIQSTLKRTEVTTLTDTLLSLISLTAPEVAPTLLNELEWASVEHGNLPSEVEQAAIDVIESLKTELPIISEPDDIFIPHSFHKSPVRKRFHQKMNTHQIDKNTPLFDESDKNENLLDHHEEKKTPSFDEHNINKNEDNDFLEDHEEKKLPTFDEHNIKTNNNNEFVDHNHIKGKKNHDFLTYTAEPDLNFKDKYPKQELFLDMDRTFEKDTQIRLPTKKIIAPDEVFVLDFLDKQNIQDNNVEILNEKIDEDIEEQEQIYEEEQMDNIHLPWFPKKPER